MTRSGRWAVVLVGLGLVAFVIYTAVYMSRIVDRFPPGAPVMSTHWEASATLSAEQPVIARAVRVDVAPTKGRLLTPELHLGVQGNPDRLDPPDANRVWLSIFNASTGESTPNPAGTGHATLDGWIGSARSFETCQTVACSSTYLLIARWRGPASGQSIPITFFADLSATVDQPVVWAYPSGPTPSPRLEGLSLATDETLAYEGSPTSGSVATSGAFRITPDSPRVDARFRLHVPATAIPATLVPPIVGHALLEVAAAEASDRKAAPWVEITGPRGRARALAGIALDVDWLSGCHPGAECSVPLAISGVFAEPASYDHSTFAPGAWGQAEWQLTVRLERLGVGPPISTDGMWLERLDG